MSNQFQTLKVEDVIALKESVFSAITAHPTFKVEDVVFKLHAKLLEIPETQWEREDFQGRKQWIDDGYKSELLSPRQKQWIKGKVRVKVTLEFCPDDPMDVLPESPLDDIRNSMQ